MCTPAAGSWTPGSSSPDFGGRLCRYLPLLVSSTTFFAWLEAGRNSNSWTTTNHLKSCLLNQRVIFASNYSWDPTSGKYQTNMTDDGFGVSFSTKAISVRMSMLKLSNCHSCVMYMWSTASSPDLLEQVFVSLAFSAHFTHFKFLSVSTLHFFGLNSCFLYPSLGSSRYIHLHFLYFSEAFQIIQLLWSQWGSLQIAYHELSLQHFRWNWKYWLHVWFFGQCTIMTMVASSGVSHSAAASVNLLHISFETGLFFLVKHACIILLSVSFSSTASWNTLRSVSAISNGFLGLFSTSNPTNDIGIASSIAGAAVPLVLRIHSNQSWVFATSFESIHKISHQKPWYQTLLHS